MTLADVRKLVEEVFPGAEILEDEDGQIVVYTGMRDASDGELVPFQSSGELKAAVDR